jgi:hypothetical protein
MLFLRIVIGGIPCLNFLGCAHFATPEQKWVPYPFKDAVLAPGVPAFMLILQTRDAACEKREDIALCHEHWAAFPKGFHPLNESEVRYLQNNNGAAQQVRIGWSSFCAVAIARKIADHPSECQELWKEFVHRKTLEES